MAKKTYSERIDLGLTDAIVEKACAIVAAGNFRYVAAQRLGVPKGTWQGWLTRGRKELAEYAEGKRERKKLTVKAKLVTELEKAEGECHSRLLQDVLDSNSIQAKQWFLERRYNKLYSTNPNAHIDDETGETETFDAAAILAEKLRQFMGPD